MKTRGMIPIFYFIITITVYATGAAANSLLIKVVPHGTYATFSIDLTEGAPVVLQISSSSPVVESKLYPPTEKVPSFFANGKTVFSRVLSERNEAGGFKTHYDFDTILPNDAGALLQDTYYYYAAQIAEKAGKRVKTGMFKTKFRVAEIYINEIHVTNDSDSTGSGEISFNFFLNNENAYKLPNNKPYYDSLSSGASLKFGNDFVLRPSGTAIQNSVLLTVIGFDDDTSSFALSSCGGSGKILNLSLFVQTGEDKCGEWTTAAKKISFTDPAFTGYKENFTKPYFLDGIDANGSELKYQVYATLKVKYL